MTTAAIGIDLGGTNLRAALVHRRGEILGLKKARTPVEEGPEATAQTMARLVAELRADFSQENILGIGIGSPGPLSREERMIFQTPNLPGFDLFPLGRRVEELSGLRTFLDNDAKCATFGEELFGAAQGMKNFVLLTLGTGIGGGVIANGHMIYGKSDGACELGHITLYPGGRLCKCGNQGCFEQYASASAIERRAFEKRGQKANGLEIFQAFQAGESWAQEVLREVSVDLAIACASLVNIFDPEAIILGGGIMSTGGGPIPQWVQEEIKDRCFKSLQRGLKILPSALGGNAGVLGAASTVFRQS